MDIRVTDLAVTPDFTRLVTIGMEYSPPPAADANPSRGSAQSGDAASVATGGNSVPTNGGKPANRMVVFDLTSKEIKSCVPRCGHRSHRHLI